MYKSNSTENTDEQQKDEVHGSHVVQIWSCDLAQPLVNAWILDKNDVVSEKLTAKVNFNDGVEKIKNQSVGTSQERTVTENLKNGTDGHTWKKLVWNLVIFLVCSAGFTYQTYDFLQHYLTYPTSVDVEESSPFEVALPAITLCSHNRFDRIEYCTKRSSSCTFYEDTQTFCDAYPRYCFSTWQTEGAKYRNYTRQEMGVPTKEAYLDELESKSWTEASEFFPNLGIVCYTTYGSGSGRFCDDRLTPIPFTNAENNPNICITISSASENPDFEEEIYPNSLSIQVNIVTRAERYFYDFDPVVVYAVVHNRMQLINPFVEGYVLEGGKNYKADISRSDIVRIKPPYSTRCFDYITAWKGNNGTGPLTQSECIEYCKLTTVRSLNKCVGPNIKYAHTEELCEFGGSASDDIIKSCTQKCQPACDEQKYEVEYREKVGTKEDFGSVLCAMIARRNELDNRSYVYGSEEHCRFRLRRQIYSEQYQSVELFSYIGGYLGLWLGLGLISVFESVGDIACYLWRRRRFKNSSNQNLQFDEFAVK